MRQPYDPEMGERIVDRFKQRNWTLYDRPDGDFDPEDPIRDGPADRVKPGRKYVMLPLTEEPTDPETVMGALDRTGEKRNGEQPKIQYNGRKVPILGLTCFQDGVKIHSPMGHEMSFTDLLDSVETLAEAETG